MKVMTVKLNPKTVFGLILVAAGVLVVLLTFLANHVKTGDAAPSAAEPAGLTCADVQAGARLLTDMGWQVGDSNQKTITLPRNWDAVYTEYNALQQQQGYDLTPYKGKQVQLYTYEITNYTGYDQGIVADLLVSNGRVIGADLCNTSAKDGFMLGLEKRK